MLARKFLSPPEFEVFLASLNRNGDFEHPENVVRALLCSESLEERKVGVEMILRIRSQPRGRGRRVWPRKFKRCDYRR